jgi:hypothetical protein
MIDGCGAVGGMRIGKGNRSIPRKPVPVLLYPSKILHDLGSSRGRRGGKPAIDHLSYGTAPQMYVALKSSVNVVVAEETDRWQRFRCAQGDVFQVNSPG